jgi:predicted ATP-grasp superfamily ATP-dependent carboligase
MIKKQDGALVIGGEHPGLGIVRSLGRRGIPVYVLDDQRCISSFSRYATRVIQVKNLRDEQETINTVMDIGERYNLRNWVLFPTRDETVAAFSRHRERLASFYRVTTPCWDTVHWAWDKKSTHILAKKLGIPSPETWTPRSVEELAPLYSRLPLAIKPAVKENFFYATGKKAWRADTPEQLNALFAQANGVITAEEVMVQEIIPGNGQHQVSYCAFFRDGQAHSTLVARRKRQHPHEFGRAATYVESADVPAIEELSERFLKEIDYYGLVEVEFKQDPRDGQYKILDVNARAWGFHSLGMPAGVDFPYLLYADQMGKTTERRRGRSGIGWLRLVTDVPTVLTGFLTGRLGLGSYLGSLRNMRVESVFCWDDPAPWLAEICLLPYLIVKKYF